jgi:hypothetical protein
MKSTSLRSSKSKAKPKAASKTDPKKRTHDARPDTVDFRDQLFVATLVEVPVARPLEDFLKRYRAATGGSVPILDQGEEGACTGFGLAAVCNYLLGTRSFGAKNEIVSARMLYEMARRYDEWRGVDYDGSSARGAMKGWHKHGVCLEKSWPYTNATADPDLTTDRADDAVTRPLGAYFRVNHKDIVAMHAALSEVGILYATADVHDGWEEENVDPRTGIITYHPRRTGGHAFAIVGFDQGGFWIQNSWGKSWGKKGFGHLSYADWLSNGYDVWVARLGAPICLDDVQVLGDKQGALRTAKVSFPDLRRHIVSIGNDGALRTSGTYGTSEEDVRRIFRDTIPEITKDWKKPRILLYAHGGLVPEDNAIQRVQDYLKPLLEAEVYPIAFIWKTDFWSTLKNILEDCVKSRRPDERMGSAKDFLLDRLDDTLERLARLFGGKKVWGEMKENAALASMREVGGARLVARCIAELAAKQSIELHAAGHSAGSILMGPVVQLLTSATDVAIPADSLKDETGHIWEPVNGLGLTIKTCTLWAAACTTGLFKETYLPAIQSGKIGAQALFSLTDSAEQDDNCARVYNKSLLYLASNSFEKEARKFFQKDGWPILGMDKFVQKDAVLRKLVSDETIDYVLAPNAETEGSIDASRASHHGDFDDDRATVLATLARIVGRKTIEGAMTFEHSARSTGERRRQLFEQTDVGAA